MQVDESLILANLRLSPAERLRHTIAPWPSSWRSAMPANSTPPANGELLHRLIDSRVDFVIVGGVAAVLQGASILTIDLDLCIPFSPENLSRLLPLLVDMDARFRAHPDRPRLTNDVERFASFRLLLLETALGPVEILREITGIGDSTRSRGPGTEMK